MSHTVYRCPGYGRCSLQAAMAAFGYGTHQKPMAKLQDIMKHRPHWFHKDSRNQVLNLIRHGRFEGPSVWRASNPMSAVMWDKVKADGIINKIPATHEMKKQMHNTVIDLPQHRGKHVFLHSGNHWDIALPMRELKVENHRKSPGSAGHKSPGSAGQKSLGGVSHKSPGRANRKHSSNNSVARNDLIQQIRKLSAELHKNEKRNGSPSASPMNWSSTGAPRESGRKRPRSPSPMNVG